MPKGKTPDEMIPDMGTPKPLGLFAWLRGRFFAGMVIAAPLAATFFILQFLITFIDNRVKPLLPPLLQPETYTNYAIPGFGVLVLVIALTVLGAVTANLVGRSLLSLTDRVFSRIPIVRNVYAAIKQLTEVLANNQQASFDRCVMVEYPKKDSWCIGFVSSHAKGEIGAKMGTQKIGVFVPTTPNPTSGFLIYVEETETIPLEMTVEEGAKMILTAGLVVPDFEPPQEADTQSVAEPEVGAEKLAQQA
ncbi:MAG: DUF502 domain-containing protein [Hyphomonadaceae bacterium]|nr:DUF502 domain-containing protein [Hyphomonadaceae bacterium]